MNNMEYKLINASFNDIDIITEYKLKSIFDYANDLSDEEINKINKYVSNSIPKLLSFYKLIVVNNKKIGCLLVTKYKEGYLLDEIYLEEEFRGLGIGSNIIKNILNKYNTVYLWVYKNNIKAFNLYLRLGFNIVEETETRFLMLYN